MKEKTEALSLNYKYNNLAMLIKNHNRSNKEEF